MASQMASPAPDPSPTTNAPYRSLLETTPLWQAIDQLVDLGLSKDAILALSKLGAADVGRILDVFKNEGRSGVDKLVRPLEGYSEENLGSWIDTVTGDRNERGRPRSQNAPRPPIDSISASTATAPATPFLQLPTVPSLQQSSSTRTRSVSSRASSSTNVTHPSSVQKRVKVAPKAPRKQLYCPDCGKDIKNGFDKHFRTHIDHLLDADIGEHDAIGCGYCPAHDLLADHGKVFRGVKDFLRHVKDVHASIPHRLHWEFNASINHILSAQPLFRRKILLMTEQDSRKSVIQGNNTFLTLSWVSSPLTKQLLKDLQFVSGRINNHQSHYTDTELDNLLTRVYQAAAQKWQPLSAISYDALPHPTAPREIPQRHVMQPPPPKLSQDAMSFAGIGQVFDTPTPTPKYASDIRSPSIPSPSPQGPPPLQHAQQTHQHPHGMHMENQEVPSYPFGSPVANFLPPTFAFDGHPPFAAAAALPPTSRMQQDSLENICKEMGISKRDLFNG